MGFLTARRLLVALTLIVGACLAPAPASAAILQSVTTGSQLMPNSTTATNITLGTTSAFDITKAFVICSTKTNNANADVGTFTCDLNNSGGNARLTITPTSAPGATTTVTYYVALFSAGVSVQRGSTTFTDTNLTPTAAPSFTAVDCTKSFVLTSVRSDDASGSREEEYLVRAMLATGASPCTSGTSSTLTLDRNEGRLGTTVTVFWQVVTMEGASVQRGTSCIGGTLATPACALGTGGTAGTTNRVVLGTAVDTAKSFILATLKGGTAINGVEGLYRTRAEFTSTGASITGVQFARSVNSISNNQQVEILYEVVSLSDGSTVQTSGASPTTIAGTGASATIDLATVVDTTRTALFFSVSGGDSGVTTRYDDTAITGVTNGSNGASSASSLTFARVSTSNVGTISMAWFAVSFFRCTTASGTAYDTLCSVGASTSGTNDVVNWSSVNTVIVARSTSSIVAVPSNGTSYTAGNTLAVGVTVIYSGVLATDNNFTDAGRTVGTAYFYKVWAKGGVAGTCSASPCYVAGVQVSVTPRAAPTSWSSIVAGGAALNPVVAGSLAASPRVSIGSNAGRLITLDTTDGTWDSVAAPTVGAVQGYLSLFPYSATEMLVGGDQSGWVYSVDPSTGSYNWIVKLNADAIQAAVSTFLRTYFTSAMTTAYPGTYDIIFVSTMNNQASGGYTNNKVFALRSDTGATLWTFSPSTLAVAPCPAGCPMDQVLGQPWVDYTRARLYLTSHDGNGGGQNSIWILDVANSGALLAKFASGDITTGPVVTADETRLLAGNAAGVLRIVNLSALTETTTSPTGGVAFKGFIWEDFNTANRIYFATTDGNVWCLTSYTVTTQCWTKFKPVAAGTVSQILLGDTWFYAGGSNGTLYQINTSTGAVDKSLAVGTGLSLGPVTTATTSELYVVDSGATIYKLALTNMSLP